METALRPILQRIVVPGSVVEQKFFGVDQWPHDILIPFGQLLAFASVQVATGDVDSSESGSREKQAW